MTLRQITKMADDLAEQHGLSGQLTLAWLNERGVGKKKFSQVTLEPEQLADLIRFARV